MHDAHFRPAPPNGLRHRSVRPPKIEGMPDANDQLRFRGDGAIHFAGAAARRSRPFIAIGSGWLMIPSSVGAMSRREPFGLRRVVESSVAKMNGTGFVV